MTARTRVDQDHLIAQLERHDDKPQGRLIVGKTGATQHGLDLFDADIPDHALPQRNVTHTIDQREDFNVAVQREDGNARNQHWQPNRHIPDRPDSYSATVCFRFYFFG
jgi:hypothetical protein